MNTKLRLGVNIDHVATLRNARGGTNPSPLRAALLSRDAGADGITIHLREDRRHIRDTDVKEIRYALDIPLNFEMAATEEMVNFAIDLKPHAVCIVPEKRTELTTEGGLDAAGMQAMLTPIVQRLKEAGIRVSLFIHADDTQVNAAKACGADIVELHTGAYAEGSMPELAAIKDAAKLAHSLGLEVHAGHGLTYSNVTPIAAIPEIVELNIGHFLMGEAMLVGLKVAIEKMRFLMDEARKAGA